MVDFTQKISFFVEHCCECGVPFAMTNDFQQRRRQDRQWFYCPAGHAQHYVGKSEEQKLREQLQRAHNETDRVRQEAAEQRRRATEISRSYKRVRERVKNGVCPCCNRTFENLARHMQTKHPDYGTHQQLRTMRLAYGMTQAQLGEECGMPNSYISAYERGTDVPKWAAGVLSEWISQQGAA